MTLCFSTCCGRLSLSTSELCPAACAGMETLSYCRCRAVSLDMRLYCMRGTSANLTQRRSFVQLCTLPTTPRASFSACSAIVARSAAFPARRIRIGFVVLKDLRRKTRAHVAGAQNVGKRGKHNGAGILLMWTFVWRRMEKKMCRMMRRMMWSMMFLVSMSNSAVGTTCRT